jgi:hypothetical protein
MSGWRTVSAEVPGVGAAGGQRAPTPSPQRQRVGTLRRGEALQTDALRLRLRVVRRPHAVGERDGCGLFTGRARRLGGPPPLALDRIRP